MIKTVNVDLFIRENSLKGPVSSPTIFIGKSDQYNELGLYSESIFGIEGSNERRQTMSWINLNCDVIHPVIFDMLKKTIFRNIGLLLSGEMKFSISEDGTLIEDPNGEIYGMTKFVENIDKIRFRSGKDEDDQRTKTINMIYRNIKEGTFFMNKLLVISPEMRPISVLESVNQMAVSELTKIYQRVIILSNQLYSTAGTLFDIMVYKMQLLLREVYEFIKSKSASKSGIIRNMMLGRRTDFSSRAVIAPDPTLEPGYIGLPMRIAAEIFEPFIIYSILNAPYSDSYVTQEFHDAVKEFLAKEETFSL